MSSALDHMYDTDRARGKVFYGPCDYIDLLLELAHRPQQAGSPQAHKYYISNNATMHRAMVRDGSNSLVLYTICGHLTIFQ